MEMPIPLRGVQWVRLTGDGTILSGIICMCSMSSYVQRSLPPAHGSLIYSTLFPLGWVTFRLVDPIHAGFNENA